MREKALQRFYWSGIQEDCYNWVAKCNKCARVKVLPKRPRTPLGEMLVGAALDRLVTNILGPFPESTWGNTYVLVVTHYFTKCTEIITILYQSAVTCAEVILDKVIGFYGCPCDTHSDQGQNYENIFFIKLCWLLEIQKMRTIPGHHQHNAQVEHFNWTLVSMINSYLEGRQRQWDRNRGALAGACHATPHESTRMTPNLLMQGREMWLPIEVIIGSVGNSTGKLVALYAEYVDGLWDQMQREHDMARKYLGRNAVRMKESCDAKCSLTHYKPGDLVTYATECGQLDVAPKLRVNFQGPYLVLNRLRDLDYQVQLDARGKQKVVHHEKLKPYVGEQGLQWAKSELRTDKTKAKWGPLVQRTQEGEMSVTVSPCYPCRMTFTCSTCNYVSELYHEMYTHVLQAHFKEKDVPLPVQSLWGLHVTSGCIPHLLQEESLGKGGPAHGLQGQ